MRLANRLLEARKAAALSQAALALNARVAIATIQKIEANDGYAPSGTTMLRLAGALGLETQHLFWSEVAETAEVAS